MRSLKFLVVGFTWAAVVSVSAGPLEYLYETKIQKAAAAKNIQGRGAFFGLKLQAGTSSHEFSQKLDHQNKQDERTFTQRYWINRTFASANPLSAPVIFYICGEGACGPYAVQGTMLSFAEKMGAYVVALEHRYYGRSQPFEDLKIDHLKYLTTQNAIEDLLQFKRAMQTEMGLTGPWILVGGSYAGVLAAYARNQFPQDFAGALASSAPVRADLDFSEYDRHVAEQAGPQCLASIQKVVSEVEGLISDDSNFEKVKSEFKASALRNRQDFLYLMADAAAGAVQYGFRSEFCQMINSGTRAGYARATEMVSNSLGDLVAMSAQAAEDENLSDFQSVGVRQWFYQTCTEYGYSQNAWPDSRMSARSAQINAAYHSQICHRLFGFKKSAEVDRINATYLAPILAANDPRILFTNGDEDPWMNLSLTDQDQKQFNPKLDVFVIKGGDHCSDLGRSGGNEIDKARSLFMSLAVQWTSSP